MKNRLKRILAATLVFSMTVGLLTFNVLADDSAEVVTEVETQLETEIVNESSEPEESAAEEPAAEEFVTETEITAEGAINTEAESEAQTTAEEETEPINEALAELQIYCENVDEFNLSEQSIEVAAEAIEGLNLGVEYADNQLIVVYKTEEIAAEVSDAIIIQSDDVNGVEHLGNSESVLVTVDEGTTLEEAAIEIAQDENVESIQPNFIFELYDEESYESYDEYYYTDSCDMSFESEGSASIGTNDTYVSRQAYLTQINIPEAWAVVNSQSVKNKVKVAVIDTGADKSHSDLGNVDWDLSVSVIGEEITALTKDVGEHGTHVLSTIAATANNGMGIAGAASGGTYNLSEYLDVFAVGAFTQSNSTSESNIIKGIEYAISKGADIINMSLGISKCTDEKGKTVGISDEYWNKMAMKKSVDNAYEAGIICVCAGGNEGGTHSYCKNFPSDDEHVISVENLYTIESSYQSRTQENYRRSSTSCYNTCKDLCAPGENIWACIPTNTYGNMSGTSMATPLVTSVVALMYMVNPGLTFNDVYSKIASTATDIVYTEGSEVACEGYDIYTGHGLVNAEACVNAAVCEHSFDGGVVTSPATCTTTGIKTYTCSKCGITKEETIPKTSHNAVKVEAKAPTCTEPGNIKCYYCTSCKKYFSDAACTKEKVGDSWIITATGHSLEKHDAVAATCTESGNTEYYSCKNEGCGKYFSDAACTNEIEENSWVTDPLGHDYTSTPIWNWTGFTSVTATFTCTREGCGAQNTVDATVTHMVLTEPNCTEPGTTIHMALVNAPISLKICTDRKTESTNPTGHSMEKHDAVAATCTESGNTEYYSCSDCNKYFSDAVCTKEIASGSWITPATGHSTEKHAAVAATCTKTGNTEYYYCKICKKYFSDAACTNEIASGSWVTPATGHSYDNGTVTKEPTYLATGVRTYHCKNCSATKTEVIPALVPDLPAGTYYIRTSLTSNKVLDIEWGSTASGANLQLYEKNETTAQQFKITYDSNGLATITNVKSGKALDVQWGNAYDGANVWQYDSNGSTAQKWKITKNSDGTYTIKSALNGNYVIDLLYGSSENGTNAQIYSSNGTNAQKYYFDEITAKPEPEPEPSKGGTYTICSALNSSKALDIEWGSTASGANLQIYDSNGTKAQKFKITYDGDGYATIINVNSGKALDVQWGSAYNGANVWQYDSNGSKAQKWKVVNNGDGTYTFKSAINENYVLDISGGSTANGANVQIYSSNGTNAQKFYLK